MGFSDSTVERYSAADPDVRLMLRVQGDDAEAFAELVERHQHRLTSLLTHLLGDRDQAEDLAQDVFLRVYRSRKRYQPGAKFSTWLYTIAHHAAANAHRSRARRREVQLPSPRVDQSGALSLETTATAASGQMPSRQIDQSELRQIVRLALETLNDRQREAVLLNKFEHLSYEEIAAVMALTPSAVKSLLTRARVNLRDVLEPYLQQGVRVESISQ